MTLNTSLLVIAFAIPSSIFGGDSNDGSIDSGGGKATVGAILNHGSIGSSFVTGKVAVGVNDLRPGLIEVLYPNAQLYDSDKNGLPDAWEIEHFGRIAVDPQDDPDSDATSNLLEYLAGTDPNDLESRFKLKGGHDGVLIYTLPIKTIEKRIYKIWATADLKNWYLQKTYTGDGSLKVYNFDESNPAGGLPHSPTHPSKYFFRVQIIDTP